MKQIIMLLAVAIFAVAGCQSPQRTAKLRPSSPAATDTLGAGDVVKISYAGAPELSSTQKIRPDGRVSLPMIGDVQAAGKTLGSFQQHLAHAYEGKLQNTGMIVNLEATAAPVYVKGAVNRPGKILLDRPLTLQEAINEAGGERENLANLRKVKVTRQVNGHYEEAVYDLIPKPGRPNPAVYVQRYDIISVPERWF